LRGGGQGLPDYKNKTSKTNVREEGLFFEEKVRDYFPWSVYCYTSD